VKSCLVEAAFLQSDLCQVFCKTSQVQIATPFDVEQDAFLDNPIDSRFELTLFDFKEEDGWKQYPHLGDRELRAVLKSLAEFHAFFWIDKRDGNLETPTFEKTKALAGSLWKPATYWHLGQQPKGQLDNLIPSWERFLSDFEEELKILGAEQYIKVLSTVGKRLKSVAQYVSQQSHGIITEGTDENCTDSVEYIESFPYQTIIHGDPKAPNFFFRNRNSVDDLPDVGMIDFQWTGQGLCATDVAYCLAASGSSEILPIKDDFVPTYLHFYYDHLTKSLVKYKVATSIDTAASIVPFLTFQKQYENAFLDLARIVVADHWKSIRPENFRERKGKMSYNAYNKSLPVALWFIARTIDYLERFAIPK